MSETGEWIRVPEVPGWEQHSSQRITSNDEYEARLRRCGEPPVYVVCIGKTPYEALDQAILAALRYDEAKGTVFGTLNHIACKILLDPGCAPDDVRTGWIVEIDEIDQTVKIALQGGKRALGLGMA